MPAHLTKSRIDAIVLRLDLNNSVRAINLKVVTGTPDDSPVPPTLTRNSAIWELGLAFIRINPNVTQILQSNITDLRLSTAFCGVVAALIHQPDLSTIFNQYQTKYNEVNLSWNSFYQTTENQWLALQSAYTGWFNQIQAEIYTTVCTDFDDWSRRTGYKTVTTFNSNGSITESIENINNSSILATRNTSFPNSTTITETITFNQPSLSVTKTTVFGSSNITETYT